HTPRGARRARSTLTSSAEGLLVLVRRRHPTHRAALPRQGRARALDHHGGVGGDPAPPARGRVRPFSDSGSVKDAVWVAGAGWGRPTGPPPAFHSGAKLGDAFVGDVPE